MNAILMLMLAADTTGQSAPDVQLLDFTASYCQPCQQMLPAIQRMEHDGYPIRRIDITKQPELAKRFQVSRIPTFVVVVEGREVHRFTGLTAEQDLRNTLQKVARQLRESRNPPPESSELPAETPRNADAGPDTPAPKTGGVAQNNAGNTDKTSVSDIFKGIFRPKGFDRPTLRGQSPDAELPDHSPMAKPLAATVRIRVTWDKLQDVGTGTIIHSTSGKSIILTCAHLFMHSKESPQVEVDVFQEGREPARYPAVVIGGSHDSDLAVLQIQNAAALPSASLMAQSEHLKPGQLVCSVGCDNGRPPSLLNSKILRINPYKGPANLTCEKDPVQGRSGGGLFDDQGRLLAVCSAADRELKEGLYMSMPAIITQLSKLSLDYVLKPTPEFNGEEINGGLFTGPDSAGAAASGGKNARGISGGAGQTAPDKAPRQSGVTSPFETPFDNEFSMAEPMPAQPAAPADVPPVGMPPGPLTEPGKSTAAMADAFGQEDLEITVLIQSKDPSVGKRMIVIPRPTPWLLELLTGENPAAPTSGTQITSAERPLNAVH